MAEPLTCQMSTSVFKLIDDFRAVREQAVAARSPFDEVLLGGPAPAVRGRDEVSGPAAN